MRRLIGLTLFLFLCLSAFLIVISYRNHNENLADCGGYPAKGDGFAICHKNDSFYLIEENGGSWRFYGLFTGVLAENGYIALKYEEFNQPYIKYLVVLKNGKKYEIKFSYNVSISLINIADDQLRFDILDLKNKVDSKRLWNLKTNKILVLEEIKIP